MLSNVFSRNSVEERENDIQTIERLTTVIKELSNLGSEEQRRGRTRTGQFVAQPKALQAQVDLESALLKVAQRVRDRA